ncbi:MAG: hypothetical protein M5U28_39980 [Sandaracinaceae bacterium]|nr:hypothetical protein [Sandaracinaceae bacterium]
MPTLELVYDRGCPHVEAARASLERACEQAGLPPRWTEHSSDDAPPHARGYGSPTILVDGRDVAGAGSGRRRLLSRLRRRGWRAARRPRRVHDRAGPRGERGA